MFALIDLRGVVVKPVWCRAGNGIDDSAGEVTARPVEARDVHGDRFAGPVVGKQVGDRASVLDAIVDGHDTDEYAAAGEVSVVGGGVRREELIEAVYADVITCDSVVSDDAGNLIDGSIAGSYVGEVECELVWHVVEVEQVGKVSFHADGGEELVVRIGAVTVVIAPTPKVVRGRQVVHRLAVGAQDSDVAVNSECGDFGSTNGELAQETVAVRDTNSAWCCFEPVIGRCNESAGDAGY